MNKPRGIQGILILLWGIQADFFWVSIPMALLLEYRYYFNRRWALSETDFYRVADVVSLVLIAVILYLFFNSQPKHFIIALIEWIPLIIYPLVAIYAYSTSERMSLDVIFYSLRKQREPVQQSWDLDYIYLGACLVAVGTNPDSKFWFFPLSILVLAITFYPLKSKRYKVSVWFMALGMVLLIALGTQFTLRQSHLALKDITANWIASWIRSRTDPLKTTTSLGRVGDLKVSDAILFRIKVIDDGPAPSLLQEAIYDLPAGTDWMVLNTGFTNVPHTGDFIWQFSQTKNANAAKAQSTFTRKINQDASSSARMYLEFNKVSALVPTPDSVTKISDLPALNIQQNEYGTLRATGLIPSAFFNMEYGQKNTVNSQPRPSDFYLPQEYEPLFSDHSYPLAPKSKSAAVAYVKEFFSDYTYSLYQPEDLANHQPLEYFLKTRKSGHCEYFATATVLMLRHLGVPARYVVGYSVQEYDSFLEMYVVRQRHAHAWAIAYVNGEWQVVDTTPSTWVALEAQNESLLRPLLNLVSSRWFAFQRWWEVQRLEDHKTELYVLGILLTLILAWRLYRSDQVTVNKPAEGSTDEGEDFADLPFYRIETLLTNAGFSRGKGELLIDWIERIEHPELVALIRPHYKWRFDPLATTEKEKHDLELKVKLWIEKSYSSTLR